MGHRTHEGPHKYKRKLMGKSKTWEVFVCVLPDCPHYIESKLLEGKNFLCWRCGRVSVATTTTRKMAKPHCRTCTRHRNPVKSNFRSVGHLPEINLDDLLIDAEDK